MSETPPRGFPQTEPFSLSARCDYTLRELEAHRRVMADYAALRAFRPASINWLVPPFTSILVGGIRTIAGFADYYRQRYGVANRLVVCDDAGGDRRAFHQEVRRAFPQFPEEDVIVVPGHRPEAVPDADAVVATFWPSAYLALKLNRTKAKLYFVQDHETLFYPSGTVSALAEATYRFGLYGICNGPGLLGVYRMLSRAPAVAFWPAVDHSVYYPLPPGEPKRRPGEPKQVVFYGRPLRPRNAFELGLMALAKVKEALGDGVRIVSVGAKWSPAMFGVAGAVEVLGLLPSLESVADLYRHSDVGLVFMMTRHPSYQPLEYMACGCATVTNENWSTGWLLHDGRNCLTTEASPSCVAARVLQLLQDDGLRSRIAQGGLLTVRDTSWPQQMDNVFRFICKSDR